MFGSMYSETACKPIEVTGETFGMHPFVRFHLMGKQGTSTSNVIFEITDIS